MTFKIKKNDLRKLIGILFAFMLLYVIVVWKEMITDSKLLFYSAILLTASWSILLVNKYQLINVSVIFLMSYLITLGVGPIVFYLTGISYHKYQLPIICYSFILFYFGYSLFGNILWKKKRFSTKIYRNSLHSIRIVQTSLLIYTIGMAATFFYILKNAIYLFSINMNDGRIIALSGNGMLIYLGKLMWLGSYICFEEYLRNNKYKRMTFSMIGIAIVLSAMLGFRSAVVDALIVLVVMLNKKKPIKQEVLIGACLVIVVGLIAYGLIRGGSKGDTILTYLYSELRVGCINFNYIYNTFPQKMDFQNGYTYLINIIMLKPGEDPDFTMWLKEILNLQFSGGGVTPTIIGELFINWGYLGIYIGMIAFGIAMRYIQEYYDRGKSIFLPALFIGYIRSFVRGGIANSFIIFIIYIVGYYGILWFSAHYSVKLSKNI